MVDNNFMLRVSEDTAFVIVEHELIAIFGVPGEFLDVVRGPQVVLESTLCKSDLELTQNRFRSGA